MNALALSLAYLRQRPLTTALNVAMLAIGVGAVALLMLFADQLRDTLARDARGVDMVVGAKGSPLQLVLSSVFHVDIPTGNIRLEDARALARNPMIGAALPLALGDSYRGWRIVGAEHAYPALFGAEVARGALWRAPLEATVGARAAAEGGLEVGTRFVGSHGVAAGGMAHADTPYRVVGVFAPTGTVLDRLIVTSIESVWRVHAPHGGEAPGERGGEGAPEDEPGGEVPLLAGGEDGGDRELTALLVQLRNPVGAATLPRQIAATTPMQAALPGFEIARLTRTIGFGVDGFRAFAYVLMASAALGIFAALSGALERRRYDIAVMRALGAGRGAILRQMLVEGCLLSTAGAALGLALGHGAALAAGDWLRREYGVGLDGLAMAAGEPLLFAAAVALGAAAALVPALRACRIDVSAALARG